MEHTLADTPPPEPKPLKLSNHDLHDLGLSRSQVQSCIRRPDGVRVTYLKPGPVNEELLYDGPRRIATRRYEEKRKSRADIVERIIERNRHAKTIGRNSEE